MDNEKIQELLLKLIEDMAYVKAKLDNIDEQKLGGRIDALEGKELEHDRRLKILENRNDTMEKYVRDSLAEKDKQNKSVWISIGMAIFTAIMSIIINLI